MDMSILLRKPKNIACRGNVLTPTFKYLNLIILPIHSSRISQNNLLSAALNRDTLKVKPLNSVSPVTIYAPKVALPILFFLMRTTLSSSCVRNESSIVVEHFFLISNNCSFGIVKLFMFEKISFNNCLYTHPQYFLMI